jgi:adenosylhomocysteinase
MSLLENTLEDYKKSGKTMPKSIVVCTHAKHSSVELCRVLMSAGIKVAFHPVTYSIDPANLDILLSLGVEVIEQAEALTDAIKKADCAIEDGARISKIISKNSIVVKDKFFSVEQTSGGIRYFQDHPPAYPVINVAFSGLKLDTENRRATPESVIQQFASETGKTLGGKNVLIIGFGSIGEGIARLARVLGANVLICDMFATKRMYAKHRGYNIIGTDSLDHSLGKQDVIFMATNTYQGDLLGVEQLLLMKDGAVICNAGSGTGELDVSLQKEGKFVAHDAKVNILEKDKHLSITLHKGELSKYILVLGRAFPINLHLGKGTSHDVVEVVMALLLLAALEGPSTYEPGVIPLDLEIQERVASLSTSDPASLSFEPTFVKTKDLAVSERPYGGVFPFHNELNGLAHIAVVRAWFKSGSKTRGHYHKRSQESYYAESGSAEIIVWPVGKKKSKKVFKMEPGDYLLVPESYFHDVLVTSKDNFESLVISSPPFQIWDQFFEQEMVSNEE